LLPGLLTKINCSKIYLYIKISLFFSTHKHTHTSLILFLWKTWIHSIFSMSILFAICYHVWELSTNWVALFHSLNQSSYLLEYLSQLQSTFIHSIFISFAFLHSVIFQALGMYQWYRLTKYIYYYNFLISVCPFRW
jgi:hypothetical protein